MYPLLSNKDIRRQGGKLVILIPELDGSMTPLSSKSLTKEAGERLIRLGNQHIQGVNRANSIKSAWERMVHGIGMEHFEEINKYQGRKMWLNFRPNLLERDSSPDPLLAIMGLIYAQYSPDSIEVEAEFLECFTELKTSQKKGVLDFLRELSNL